MDRRVVTFEEVGPPTVETDATEVVIGVSVTFGEQGGETMAGVSHTDALRELMAGAEEKGVESRIIRIHDVADLAKIGHRAAQLSGSGISIGIQSRGTAIIHQENLNILENLELFPQAPLLDKEQYRRIGENAAAYARRSAPSPVPVRNDEMIRPKYQALSALYHSEEVQSLENDQRASELEVEFTLQ